MTEKKDLFFFIVTLSYLLFPISCINESEIE